jgi:hypothetical protein
VPAPSGDGRASTGTARISTVSSVASVVVVAVEKVISTAGSSGSTKAPTEAAVDEALRQRRPLSILDDEGPMARAVGRAFDWGHAVLTVRRLCIAPTDLAILTQLELGPPDRQDRWRGEPVTVETPLPLGPR